MGRRRRQLPLLPPCRDFAALGGSVTVAAFMFAIKEFPQLCTKTSRVRPDAIAGMYQKSALSFHPVCGCRLSSCSVLKNWLENVKQEVRKFDTSLQWHQISLSCFSLISSAFQPLAKSEIRLLWLRRSSVCFSSSHCLFRSRHHHNGACHQRMRRRRRVVLPEVLSLKHKSRILGQCSNPVSGSRKSKASSPWVKQQRV